MLLEYHVHNDLHLVKSLFIEHLMYIIFIHLECLRCETILTLVAALDEDSLALNVRALVDLRVEFLDINDTLRLRLLLGKHILARQLDTFFAIVCQVWTYQLKIRPLFCQVDSLLQ